MSPTLPAVPLLAVISGDAPMTLLQDVGYQTVGMGIVLGALGIMALTLFITGHFFAAYQTKINNEKARQAEATHPALAEQEAHLAHLCAAEAADLPAELRAVIVAAVYASLGESTRVLDIQSAHPELAAWSMEGRRQIFLSHRVR